MKTCGIEFEQAMNDDKRDDNDGTYYGFRDGMPTGPDVTALMKRWPELKVGDHIPYANVERVIGVAHRGKRWRSITNAWRRRLKRDHQLVLRCQKTEKVFFVAGCAQLLRETPETLEFTRRKMRRHRSDLATIIPKDEQEKVSVEHNMRLVHNVEQYLRKQEVNLLPNTQTKTQPKILPPRK